MNDILNSELLFIIYEHFYKSIHSSRNFKLSLLEFEDKSRSKKQLKNKCTEKSSMDTNGLK